MMNQKKCGSCGKWTKGDLERCVYCNSLIDPVLIEKERKAARLAKAREERLQNESRFEKYLRELQESEKPSHKFLFGFLNIAFTIYMGILSFFIWLIALISS
jgi:hypothetical protein